MIISEKQKIENERMIAGATHLLNSMILSGSEEWIIKHTRDLLSGLKKGLETAQQSEELKEIE